MGQVLVRPKHPLQPIKNVGYYISSRKDSFGTLYMVVHYKSIAPACHPPGQHRRLVMSHQIRGMFRLVFGLIKTVVAELIKITIMIHK